jgi:Integral membrane protein TerC family
VLVEATDLIFAVDSIPAVFAVTRDPFLVYSSNVFAILGLRALYFLLSGVIETFRYLKIGLSVVLVFIGAKMLMADVYEVPIGFSLGIIALLIAASVIASLLTRPSEGPPQLSRADGGSEAGEVRRHADGEDQIGGIAMGNRDTGMSPPRPGPADEAWGGAAE